MKITNEILNEIENIIKLTFKEIDIYNVTLARLNKAQIERYKRKKDGFVKIPFDIQSVVLTNIFAEMCKCQQIMIKHYSDKGNLFLLTFKGIDYEVSQFVVERFANFMCQSLPCWEWHMYRKIRMVQKQLKFLITTIEFRNGIGA